MLETDNASPKPLNLLLDVVGRTTSSNSSSDREGGGVASSPAVRSALRLLAALVLDRSRLLGLDINPWRARDVPEAVGLSMELKGEFLFPPSRPMPATHVS